MTVFHFIIVLFVVLGSWLAMAFVMRSGPANWWRTLACLAFLATMIGGFVLGSYYRGDKPEDFLCKPGQHCFPWGD